MGGRGSFDTETQSIPVENRKYKELDVIDGIKVIEHTEIKNGPTPVMSNTANTVYAVYSGTAKRIAHVFFYEDHVLKYMIDIEDGDKSHSHKMFINKETGEIGRKSHSKKNEFVLTNEEKELVKRLKQWKKK